MKVLRDTPRKRFIRAALEERGTLVLDELRWIVLRREARGAPPLSGRARMQSFARTVREHMPELDFLDVGLGKASDCPAALAVRTAVYRVREQASLDAFLNGPSPTIVWRYVTELPVDKFGELPRYESGRFVTPQFHLHMFDLYARYENDPGTGQVHQKLVDRVRIPPAHKVTVIRLKDSCEWSPSDVQLNPEWRVIRPS